MEYRKSCLHCRKQFISKRSDAKYHNGVCKTTHWRLLKGFDLVGELIPQKEVEEKYYVHTGEQCTIYLQWFHIGDEKFADVWYSKDCKINVNKRFKGLAKPIRRLHPE